MEVESYLWCKSVCEIRHTKPDLRHWLTYEASLSHSHAHTHTHSLSRSLSLISCRFFMGLPTPLRQSRINAHPYIRITNETPMQSRSHPANVVHALFKMVSNNRFSLYDPTPLTPLCSPFVAMDDNWLLCWLFALKAQCCYFLSFHFRSRPWEN